MWFSGTVGGGTVPENHTFRGFVEPQFGKPSAIVSQMQNVKIEFWRTSDRLERQEMTKNRTLALDPVERTAVPVL